MSIQQQNTVMDIKLGSALVCQDGPAGHVTRLVVDPKSRQITHLVVKHGLLAHVVVPIEAVAQVQDDTVMLTLHREELAALPRYAEVDYTVPEPTGSTIPNYLVAGLVLAPRVYTPGSVLAAAWAGSLVREHTHRGMSAEELPVGRGTRITCSEGLVGRLDHVLLNPANDVVQALVVRKGHMLGKDVIIPADRVTWFDEDEIYIKADRRQLEGFPKYQPARSDEQITNEVQSYLGTDERTQSETSITVQTEHGLVQLSGVVRTDEARSAAAEVARAVAGVWEVTNELLVGWDVARTVSDALNRDARTARAMIESTYSDGSLTLRGQVRTVQEKMAAVEIARSVPEVGAVIDELEVRSDVGSVDGPEPDRQNLLALGVWMSPTRRA